LIGVKEDELKICCLSDLHGHLPEVPECDLLLLGGDYPPDHDDWWWYRKEFKSWIDETAKRCKIVGVAGNHDFVMQEDPDLLLPMDWTYLLDSGTEFGGLKIWGSPWQPRFFDWAFNADELQLGLKWNLIPEDTDILLLHGPPFGYRDFSPVGGVHTGSPSLTETIKRIQPKLVVCGHIHRDYGLANIRNTLVVNASYVDENYKPANEPVIVEINGEGQENGVRVLRPEL
jgi:Icc-related predicted phosphoesterase